MRALIFAAGMGTRLKPLTDTLPKALVPVCGKPLLEHVVEKLKAAGFSEIVINIHHFAQKIKDFVRENNSFDIDVYFSDETDLLRETGGGIRHAATLLNDGEPFLVHNVDILSNLDVKAFYETHLQNMETEGDAPLSTLLVSDRETDRYLLFDSENNLVAWINIRTGEVKSPFAELRREPVAADAKTPAASFDYQLFLEEYQLTKYAFAGIHVISPRIFTLMSDRPEKFSIIGFYLSVCDKFPIKAYPMEGLKLVDVGKVDSLEPAEAFLKEQSL